MNQLPILTAQQLLDRCGIDPLLNEWRALAGMDNGVFDALMLKPLYQFAESVQLAPASETHHHCGPGGLLKHTVDVITIALKKRRGYQLPIGGNISEINHQRHLWTFGIFIACLLHDIGKLSANIRLIINLKNGNELQWTPHDVPLTKIEGAKSYRVEFAKTPYDYHHRVSLTHFDIVPRDGRAWISQFPLLMSQLCSYLWGDRFESGVIGDIAEFADRESTARDLKLPNDQRFSNAHSAIDRYLKMIRQWIADGAVRINANGGMGWVDHEGHLYLVCRSLAEKIIHECASLGLKNLPQDPIRIYDILQEHGYALPTPDGKAVWTIQIKTETFTHKFTCLKFEARKFAPSNRILAAVAGTIEVLDAQTGNEPEAAQEAASATVENVINIENAKNRGGDAAQRREEEQETLPFDTAEIALDAGNDSAKQENESAHEAEQETIGAGNEILETAVESSYAKTTSSADEAMSCNSSAADDLGSDDNKGSINIESENLPRQFLSWLKKGLIEKTILINDAKAEVHIVEEGVFLLSPAIFKTYLNRHGLPGETLHKNLSRRFGRLRLHIRNGDVNIHPYWVFASNRASKINGWLLPFKVIYEHDYPIPKPNKFIKKTLE